MKLPGPNEWLLAGAPAFDGNDLSGSTAASPRSAAPGGKLRSLSKDFNRTQSDKRNARQPADGRPEEQQLLGQDQHARTAIQSRFIKPPTNSSTINIQQHPRQNKPCIAPARSGLNMPWCQKRVSCSAGERHWTRQACFHGVH